MNQEYGLPITYKSSSISSIEDIRDLCELIPFSGCWIWRGGLTSVGYGYISRLRLLVHRLSFRLANGRQASGLVCHHCDVKCCVNPEHLYDGTKRTNIMDAINRGKAKNLGRKRKRNCDLQIAEVALLMKLGMKLGQAASKVGLYSQMFERPPGKQQLQSILDKQ